MPNPEPIPPMPISRAAAGWGLIGVGGSLLAAALISLRFMFVPGRRSEPILKFSFDHPVLVVLVPMLLIGAVALAAGLWLKGSGAGGADG